MKSILELIRTYKPSLVETFPLSLAWKPQNKLFSDIVNYEDIKETLNMFLDSKESINVLLTGAPATAKTLFLLSMMKYCKNAYFLDASNASGAGVLDQLFGARGDTKILLMDEIDKLKRNDQGTLLNLLETGMLISTKVRKQRTKQFTGLKVFATSNEVFRLSKALQSRFFRIHLKEYTDEEFLSIAKQMYPKNAELSEYIAKAVLYQIESRDIRDFVQIAKHAKNFAMADKLIGLRIKYHEDEEEAKEGDLNG